MKKLILVALTSSVVATSSLMASDWYIGASVSGSSVKLDTTGATSTNNSSGSKAGFGVKGGYGFNDSNSVELEYVSITTNITGTRLNYVYRYPIGDVKPFIGGGIGFIKYKEDFTVGGNIYAFDKGVTSWNIKGGVAYQLAKHHEVELGYDYISVGNMSQNYTTTTQVVDINLKNIRVGRLYAQYNFRF